MEAQDKITDCSRGTVSYRTPEGELKCDFHPSCCKLSVQDWLKGIPDSLTQDLFEVRFKNTRKLYFKNTSGQSLKVGDIVVVEAQNGHDVGIVSLSGPVVLPQLKRNKIDVANYEFRKVFRTARPLDIERWQEAIAREHQTMIKARQLAASLNLNMKIGDVEFQGDGTKAIFYYIADERVDFRQLIRLFAEEFRIRIEMKQIGARQEAGLIGGIGVCGQELCCARYMSDFKSITTQAARTQDLSLNPQKLAGQCSKLKCCINYEAAAYIDAHTNIPQLRGPLETEEGPAYLVKTDTLKARMWFSYEQNSMTNMFPLDAERVKEIVRLNRKGVVVSNINPLKEAKNPEFMSAVGEDSISRFDDTGNGNKKSAPRKNNKGYRGKKRIKK
ncbi:MAG: regulatory iron-sulfur-containing complex subunit RicT [Bacteroidales bacterium]|jgi:cell fate regulator YaaT (PSP1 superfamily)|nr:regulatory iron-sulfur-containing complex subunit RicT [Bacteroidales bacterium]MDD3299824.1 regulatory iron-sulfur-containing complex subunit RicT [Bacteroidales bacterium]MDD3843048.1 regulatory iron-sulfur-containing complex subunit RicT [Bacteroidales bacterium]MDD4618550.1 regulatory iron-sulfur-containing complex subunit RicT [Bacteroidales bacterium]